MALMNSSWIDWQKLTGLLWYTVSENGDTALDGSAATKELLEEQSVSLLTREYIELIGCCLSFLWNCCQNIVWLHKHQIYVAI